jgi:hypothetical protein
VCRSLALVALPVALAGCNAIFGIDGLGGAGAATTASGSTSGAGAGGAGAGAGASTGAATGGGGTAKPKAPAWTRVLTGLGDKHVHGCAIAAVDDLDPVFGGAFEGDLVVDGTLALGAKGTGDGFVARIRDKVGTVKWLVSSAGTEADSIDAVAAGPGGPLTSGGQVAVAGAYTGTVSFGKSSVTASCRTSLFVASLAVNDGSERWLQSPGCSDTVLPGGVAVDSNGKVVIAGTFTDEITLPGKAPQTAAGSQDVFVAMLGQQGAVQSYAFGGDGLEQRVLRTVVDSNDDVVVAGTYRGTLQWTTLPPKSTSNGSGAARLWIGKLGGSLSPIWLQDLFVPHVPDGLAVDDDDNIYVAATTPNPPNLFVAKLAPSGDVLWTREGSAAQPTAIGYVKGLAVDDAGDAFVVGQVSGGLSLASIAIAGPLASSDGVDDAFFVELGGGGVGVSSGRFGDPQSRQRATSVCVIDEAVFMGGDFDDSIDFGGGPITKGATHAAFMVRLDR